MPVYQLRYVSVITACGDIITFAFQLKCHVVKRNLYARESTMDEKEPTDIRCNILRLYFCLDKQQYGMCT